jgi:hypothetical protein
LMKGDDLSLTARLSPAPSASSVTPTSVSSLTTHLGGLGSMLALADQAGCLPKYAAWPVSGASDLKPAYSCNGLSRIAHHSDAV